METTLTPPLELITPADLDHGLTLVHRNGSASNYLHEVSVTTGNVLAFAFLHDAGYSLKVLGWRREGQQFWVCRKQFPLTVGAW